MEQPKPTFPGSPNFRVVPPVTMFGEYSMQVTCGNCHMTINTTPHEENGACVLVAVVVLLVVFFPLFWIPLIGKSCKDVSHYCPACGAKLGVYKRLAS